MPGPYIYVLSLATKGHDMYKRIMTERKFLPERITSGRDLMHEIAQRIKDHRGYTIDEMTDQIDVYCGRRKVATYFYE